MRAHPKSSSIPPDAPPKRGDRERRSEELLCPRVVDDVGTWLFFQRGSHGDAVYIAGSLSVDKYIMIPAEQLPVVREVLSFLDGRHSLEWIQDHLRETRRIRVDTVGFYKKLAGSNLLAWPAPTKAVTSEIKAVSVTLLELDVSKLFLCAVGLSRLLWPWIAAVSALAVLAGIVLQILDVLSSTHGALATLGNPLQNLALYYACLFFCFVFHEGAHGIVALRYGLVPRKVCLALYFGFLPMVYIRIGGTHTLPERRRLAVWSAGIWWNFTCAGLILTAIHLIHFSPAIHHTLTIVASANWWLGIVNLFPFLPTDGYLILCTLLRTPNIRSGAWKEFGRWIRCQPNRLSGLKLVYLVLSMGSLAGLLWRLLSQRSHSAFDPIFWLTVVPILWLAFRKIHGRYRQRHST